MTEEVDENLYERVRKGDIKAFELFFNKYQPRLFAFCLNFVEDEDAAKDLVQESFILFWENHSQINANYAVVSYLFKIAHSCCCRYIRENSLNSHLSDLPGHELKEIELAYYKDDTVLSSIYVKDIETYYNKVIEKLPKQSQIVFKLRQRDGLNAYNNFEEVFKNAGDNFGTSNFLNVLESLFPNDAVGSKYVVNVKSNASGISTSDCKENVTAGSYIAFCKVKNKTERSYGLIQVISLPDVSDAVDETGLKYRPEPYIGGVVDNAHLPNKWYSNESVQAEGVAKLYERSVKINVIAQK